MNLFRLSLMLMLSAVAPPLAATAAITLELGAYHVHPGDEIQTALDAAATNATVKNVIVHEGVYRPGHYFPALIWFNKKHEGVRLEGVGKVVLSAANPELCDKRDRTYPAMVNHVVYFGSGVTSNTWISNIELTGARHYVTTNGSDLIEPDTSFKKGTFFHTDGGAVKIFGKSYPTLDRLVMTNNFSSPCAAGISVEQMGAREQAVTIQNCIFWNNRAQVTGGALDLLEGSAARVVNCLFVDNASNMGVDIIGKKAKGFEFANNGAVTVFWDSQLLMDHCTFTRNRNGVDDMAKESVYKNCVFYGDALEVGLPGHPRFELHLEQGAKVADCVISGSSMDPAKSIDPAMNLLDAPDPQFDAAFVPRAPQYKNAGYRPVH